MKANECFIIPGTAGYGDRIFVCSDAKEDVLRMLKAFCCWGGHDKVWENDRYGTDLWGFEFSTGWIALDGRKLLALSHLKEIERR